MNATAKVESTTGTPAPDSRRKTGVEIPAVARSGFERALRERANLHEPGRSMIETEPRNVNLKIRKYQAADELSLPPPNLGLQPVPGAHRTATSESIFGPSPAGRITEPSATAERIVTASRHSPEMPALTAAACSMPGAQWQATVSGPHGLTVQIQANREVATAGQAAAWSIGIAIPTLQAATLSRLSGRLAERLHDRLPGRSVLVSSLPGREQSGSEDLGESSLGFVTSLHEKT